MAHIIETSFFLSNNFIINVCYYKLTIFVKQNSGGGGGGHEIVNSEGDTMPTRNGLQFTGGVTVSDDSTNDRTVIELPIEMLGASTLTPGTHGLVPAPSAGDENKFLKGDGTWSDAGNDVNLSVVNGKVCITYEG